MKLRRYLKIRLKHKHQLYNSYINREQPSLYIPTTVDTCDIEMDMNDTSYRLSITDTAGAEVYDRLRPLSYVDTDILILCFAVNSPPSFRNLKDKWILEVLHFAPNVPVILVGTKVDRRNDPDVIASLARIHEKPITTAQGKKLAKDIGAMDYVECSAIERKNIKNVFETAVRTTLNKKKSTRRLKKMKQCHSRRRHSMFEFNQWKIF